MSPAKRIFYSFGRPLPAPGTAASHPRISPPGCTPGTTYPGPCCRVCSLTVTQGTDSIASPPHLCTARLGYSTAISVTTATHHTSPPAVFAGHPEVTNGHHAVPVAVQYVGGLQVAMKEPAVVHVLQRAAQLNHNPLRLQ